MIFVLTIYSTVNGSICDSRPDIERICRHIYYHLLHMLSIFMGISEFLYILPTNESDQTPAAETHIECRNCGTNLEADLDTCPDCGGNPAVYQIS